MSSVFSMDPEGMTRAWPMVPLISRKASATQNQAMISRRSFWLGVSRSSSGVSFLDFTVVLSVQRFRLSHQGQDSRATVTDGTIEMSSVAPDAMSFEGLLL